MMYVNIGVKWKLNVLNTWSYFNSFFDLVFFFLNAITRYDFPLTWQSSKNLTLSYNQLLFKAN